MNTYNSTRRFSRSLLCGAAVITLGMTAQIASAQEEEDAEARQKIVLVTGTRIQQPGIVSASPVSTIGQQEIEFQQVAEVEKLLRNLPITIPGDGQNVNNGTAGASTVDLRGLGPQRNLVMVDGKRMIPFDVNGRVDVSTIPIGMLERVDVITGGASAVYGSDAMAGALNFIMKKNFNGVELDTDYQVTGDSDGEIFATSLTMGTDLNDGRGNVTMGINYTKREGVQLSARDFGVFGVDTETGDGASGDPAGSPARCDNAGTTLQSGSTTSIPARLDLVSGQVQFNNDGTLGASCNQFNFNPFNYYQTPQERFSGTAIGYYDITPDVETYGRFMFSSINVTQQVAPSGVFGNQFLIPLMNPFLSDQARTTILDNTNTFLAANPSLTFADVNVTDNNNNGVFDLADSILTGVRRRTVELGPRTSGYDSNQFQVMIGARGDLLDWDWDLSYQHGEVDRVETRTGYTNVTNIAIALNTVDAASCITPQGTTTSGCVPLNVFGPIGSITPEATPFSSAVGVLQNHYTQDIFSASISGPWDMLTSPLADRPVALAFGAEYREESGETVPDECLKELPSSCLGGAGGNVLPVTGGFNVYEFFAEAIAPLAVDQPFAKDLSLEFGYRYSDYDPTGVNETWKIGASWEIVEGFRLRAMQQKAARAPNVGELASPVVTGLSNAVIDPCSVANLPNITAAITTQCIATGVLPALVGVVPDITAGQINAFSGTDLLAPPEPEEADTTTIGVVWEPGFLGETILNPLITVDYYDIDIQNTIGTFSAQEVLDGCYNQADAGFCSLIKRVNGSFASPASGVQLFTTNLEFLRAEGIEIGVRGGLDLGGMGEINASFNSNIYLTNESQSTPSAPVIDCLGKYGTDCPPTPEFRFVQRTTWSYGDLELSYFWRHLGAVDLQEAQKSGVFDGFEHIGAFDYIDLSGAYDLTESVRLSLSVSNVLDKNPPIIGNDTGTTSANSGNTFPSFYDTLGRVYAIGFNFSF